MVVIAAPVAAGIITGAATMVGAPLANFALQELKSKIKKHTPLADMHKALNDGLGFLLASQNDKDMEVSNNVRQKDVTNIYLQWKKCVSEIEKQVTFLNEKYNVIHGSKPKLKEKRSLKSKIKTALKEVIELAKECPEKVVVDKPREWVPERVIKEIGVPSIENYGTLRKALQDVQHLLKSDRVKCVALRGQKGVGKTTIMRHLNNYFYDIRDNENFDMVIFIKMADDEQIEDLHILHKIADTINVPREVTGIDEVARSIQKVLEDKRYLLILDGVRRAVDRIWQLLNISKDKKDSKVVITTCYPLAWKSACVQRVVELKKLSHDEEWKMFQDIVGNNLLPDISKAETQQICKSFCCCLPLLIAPIAKSLKYQEAPIDWKGKRYWPEAGVEGIDELLRILKVCYEELRDTNKQKCFLYASLYPANSNICTRYLVECYIVQGFLGDVLADTKYCEMRRRAKDVILRHLVNVTLLEEEDQMRYVKMTDLYRQLALYISKDPNSGCRIYVDDEEHGETWKSTSWKDAKWVSMVDSKSVSLDPTSQNYGSLETLVLQKNLRLVARTDFCRMKKLLVLNLNGAEIETLPSLSKLTRLKALYLNDCSHLNISQSDIQELKDLEVLDIRGTPAQFMPHLRHLRCLRMSYTRSISQKISRITQILPKLEELNIEAKSLFQLELREHEVRIRAIAIGRNVSFEWDWK